ncbi:MAG: hypothetical protein Q8O55_09980, partial [Dehalococcoidales bacterium]|nr:hypothetical protein [Dehalococcoidales bacterium]
MTNYGGEPGDINYGIVCNKCDQIHNENWDCEIRRTDELNPDEPRLDDNGVLTPKQLKAINDAMPVDAKYGDVFL